VESDHLLLLEGVLGFAILAKVGPPLPSAPKEKAMTKYNDAELHAIKELDPQGYLSWHMPDLDPDLVWYTWLESQVAPPPGTPFLRCDCVAGLRSRSGSQAPWACLIEAQAQPIPRMGVWMLVYLGLLHEDLRFGPHDRDRFPMMAAVLNLTDTPLSTTIDWTPPVKPLVPPPEQQPIGVKSRFWVRNVREEKAEQTLEGIAEGKIALCILVWVPLMANGDDPRVVQRWQEVALLQKEPHLLADYVVLALVFADLAGRGDAWSPALKEFNVNDSRIAQQWEDKGLAKGKLVGQIQAFQEILKQPLTPEKELRARSEQDLDSLLAQLRKQLPFNGQ
jgi:hypothetical protein